MSESATQSRSRPSSWPGRAYRALGRLEEALAVLLLIGIVSVVSMQVIGRYLLTNPFIWPEEVTRLMLVWLTFIGSAAVTRHGAHIAVDLAVNLLPAPARRVADLGLSLTTAVVFGWVAWLAAGLAGNVATLPLAATRWSMAVMVWPAAVGCGLIAFHSIVRAAGGGERP